MREARAYASWLAVAFGVASTAASAQADDRTALTTMHLTVLTYDRSMKNRGDDKIVTLGVVYNPDSQASQNDAQSVGTDFATSALNITLNKRQVKAVMVPWQGNQMGQDLRANKVDLLYVAAGTWTVLDDIKRVAKARKLPTLAGSRAMIAAGLGLGVVPGEHGPRILINRKAARAHGMSLDARVYRHAELIDEDQ